MSVKWQNEHHEQFLEYLHAWRERNRARTRMTSRLYYWKHRVEIHARSAEKRRATEFFRSLNMQSCIGQVELPDAPPPDPEAEALAKKERRREYEHRRWLAIKSDPERHRRRIDQVLASHRRLHPSKRKTKTTSITNKENNYHVIA